MKNLIRLTIVIALWCALYELGTKQEKIVTIKSIDHKISGMSSDDISDTYLVYTKDNGVFENTDALFSTGSSIPQTCRTALSLVRK
jgi:hypothetical protein